jgi:hypothetical protein
MAQTISFVDLVLARQEKYLPDRNAPANTRTAVRVTADGLVWVIDLAMIVLNTNSLRYVDCMLGIMHDDGLFTSRIVERCLDRDGKTITKLLTLENALLFINTFPCVNTEAFRSKACEILTNALAPAKSNKRKRESEKQISYIICCDVDTFPDTVFLGRSDDIPATLAGINNPLAKHSQKLLAMTPTYHPLRDEKVTWAFFDEHRVPHTRFFKTSVESVQSLFKRIKTDFDDEHNALI